MAVNEQTENLWQGTQIPKDKDEEINKRDKDDDVKMKDQEPKLFKGYRKPNSPGPIKIYSFDINPLSGDNGRLWFDDMEAQLIIQDAWEVIELAQEQPWKNYRESLK